MTQARLFALLPAAGVGARMSTAQPKQYLPLSGRPMLWHAIDAFETLPPVVRTHVVLAPDDAQWATHDWSGLAKLITRHCGGATRAESVLNGLNAMLEDGVHDDDWILVHDAARPCVSRRLLDKLVAEVGQDPVGGILAAPVADTLKRSDGAGRILETVSRARLWAAQTPQMFRYGLLRRALDEALRKGGDQITDEASAIEALGLSPRLVESDLTNLKVTYPRDLAIAEWLLTREDR